MNSRGFTLVEAMVTLAIMALVIAVTVPLTGGWVASANRLDAQGALTEAFGHARGAAIRNAMAASADSPVAKICLESGELKVLQGTAVSAAAGGDHGGSEAAHSRVRGQGGKREQVRHQ